MWLCHQTSALNDEMNLDSLRKMQTVWGFRRWRWAHTQALLSKCAGSFSSIINIVEWWNTLSNTLTQWTCTFFSWQVQEISGILKSLWFKLLWQLATFIATTEEIQPKMLDALDTVKAERLICLFNVARNSGTVPFYWQILFIYLNKKKFLSVRVCSSYSWT